MQIPANLGYDDAATVPLGFDTASTGLYGDAHGIGLTPPWAEGGLKKYSGDPIVVIGGSSSVGSYGKLRVTVKMCTQLPCFSHPARSSLWFFAYHDDSFAQA
jgi:hypothetical protein